RPAPRAQADDAGRQAPPPARARARRRHRHRAGGVRMTTAPGAPPSGATILVVDDDHDSREIAARLLERVGYRCRRAASGAECRAMVEREPVALILLGVTSPGGAGFAVGGAPQERGRHTPIIPPTARDAQDPRLEGIHHGVAEFLTKPINRVELYAR